MMLPWFVGLNTVLVLVIIGTLLWYAHRQTQLYHQFDTRLTTMDASMLHVEDAVPIDVALQNILKSELTHFHTPEVDQLLAKLGPPFTLTDLEELQLYHALQQRSEDMGASMTQSEREAAQILPLIINRIRRGQRKGGGKTLVLYQVVSMVQPPTEETGRS